MQEEQTAALICIILFKLTDPVSVEMNRNISKIIRSTVYFLEFSCSFADAIRSDSTSSFSVIDNREIQFCHSHWNLLESYLHAEQGSPQVNCNENYLHDLDFLVFFSEEKLH